MRTRGPLDTWAPDHGGLEVNVLSREAMELQLREFASRSWSTSPVRMRESAPVPAHRQLGDDHVKIGRKRSARSSDCRRGYDLLPYLPVLAASLVIAAR